MRASRICSGSFVEPDGVHLTMSGYRYMWQKTRDNVGVLSADLASGSSPKAVPAGGDAETTETPPASVPASSTMASRPEIRAQRSYPKRRLITEIHTLLATPRSSLV